MKEEKLSETFELENMITEDTASSSIKSNKKLPQQSYIITGVDSDQIHQENINMLNKMSEREILEEQQRLLSTLDPDIVRFLKSKRKHTGPTSAPENKENIFEPPVDVQQIETPREILKNHGSEKWLNFDLIEQEKLQWMKNIDLPRKPNDNQEYEARYVFNSLIQIPGRLYYLNNSKSHNLKNSNSRKIILSHKFKSQILLFQRFRISIRLYYVKFL